MISYRRLLEMNLTWKKMFLSFLAVLISFSALAKLPQETENLIPFKILQSGNCLLRLEVCGCRMNMLGGLAARSLLIEEEKEGIERCLLLDSGHLFAGKDEYDQRIAEVYLQAMELMGYDAMLVSESEFLFGADFIVDLLSRSGVPAVATNLVPPEGVDPPWHKILRMDFPRLRVAIIGLLPEETEIDVSPYRISDPIQAASDALEEIGDSADFVIALTTIPQRQLIEFLRKVSGVDLILSGEPGRPHQRSYTASISHSGSEGKYINVIEANFNPNSSERPFAFFVRTKNILPEGGDDPIIRGVINQFYEEVRQESVSSEKDFRLFTDEPIENMPSNEYVGSEACKECHTQEYQHWDSTLHSSAAVGLLNKNRHFVPKCVTCHSTGYNYPGGYQQIDVHSPFARVGCESCHGPGKRHIGKPEDSSLIRLKVPDQKCKVCHDQANDPNFEEQSTRRRKGILHSGFIPVKPPSTSP